MDPMRFDARSSRGGGPIGPCESTRTCPAGASSAGWAAAAVARAPHSKRAAYDKERADRTWAAAVQVAGTYVTSLNLGGGSGAADGAVAELPFAMLASVLGVLEWHGFCVRAPKASAR